MMRTIGEKSKCGQRPICGLWLWSLFCGLLLVCVGCSPEEPVVPSERPEAPYGYILLGEEQIPVESFVAVEEDGFFLLKLSPLEDVLTATTYAVVGVHTAFLGEDMDVTTKYHNDDYMVVYEDPLYYYAPYRALRSGRILIDRNSSGVVRVRVDVVLYDGTPLSYENAALMPQSTL